jgi:hypothetical protein
MEKFFEEIRPFNDDEVPQAIREVLAEPEFAIFVDYLFPERKREEVYAEFASYKTIFEFQWNFAYKAIGVVLKRSVKKLTFSGIKELSPESNYLFMSNHRDIVLDPALMNVCLIDNNFQTAQMAIGNNLLISPMITTLFKLNKSFIVQRNESPRQLYEAWRKLSAYISHVVSERKENLWIAQREGRAKDGDDRTMTGILKMFLMNFGGDYINTIRRLNIVPVSVSYEYDPCDYLKALELFSIANELPFKKDNSFNLQSMLTGLQGQKGRIHISFGRPLNDVVDLYPGLVNQNDWIKWLTNLIDTEIHRNYHLWPTNYMAYDMLFGTHKFGERYTAEMKEEFNQRLNEQLKDAPVEPEALKTYMLTNYATCVINKINALSGSAAV